MRRDAERILSECIDYIGRDDAFCRDYALHGRSAIVKFVMAVCFARLSWDNLPHDCRAATAVLWTALSDTLGPTRVGHVLDCLRGTVEHARVQDLGGRIAMMWSRSTPSDLQRMATRSGASSSTRERSPTRPDETASDTTNAQVLSECLYVWGSWWGLRFSGEVMDESI